MAILQISNRYLSGLILMSYVANIAGWSNGKAKGCLFLIGGYTGIKPVARMYITNKRYI
jgi:hypothetical protein